MKDGYSIFREHQRRASYSFGWDQKSPKAFDTTKVAKDMRTEQTYIRQFQINQTGF